MFRSKIANYVLIFCAAISLAGCAGSVLGGGPNENPYLEVTPSSVQFGNVPLGTEYSQTVQVKAIGASSVTVRSIEVTGKFFTFVGPTLPLTLAPGQSISLTAEFRPGTIGSKPGAIFVLTDAPDPRLQIPMSGVGGKANIALTATPASLAFGPVSKGTVKSQNVSLKSTGNTPVQISRISILGTEFKLSQGSAGAILKPGQTLDLTVAFNPAQNGTANGMLDVASNAPAVLQVPLGGIGADAGASHSVDLRWGPSSTSGVIGYNVYRGNSADGTFTKLNTAIDASTTYSDSSVAEGRTYFYAVTAVDSHNVESAFSAPASVSVP
ncbi:MAG: choice-of-anchor D domain-containing protein [Candidatus Acidiferrales bacterium]